MKTLVRSTAYLEKKNKSVMIVEIIKKKDLTSHTPTKSNVRV